MELAVQEKYVGFFFFFLVDVFLFLSFFLFFVILPSGSQKEELFLS